jgi:hypothetical protein
MTRTLAHLVRAGLPVAVRSRPHVDGLAEKIEAWVERSRGKARAGVCRQWLVSLGHQARAHDPARGRRGEAAPALSRMKAPASKLQSRRFHVSKLAVPLTRR